MPCFSWKGIDLLGKEHSGTDFASSIDILEKSLFKNGIGLMSANRSFALAFAQTPTTDNSIAFLKHLSMLLESGVHITHALSVLAKVESSGALKEIIYDIFFEVEAGGSLSDALEKQKSVFGNVCVVMVKSGQESGELAVSLNQFVSYVEQIEKLRKKIRSAALMPLFTLALFIIIALVIFLFLVPSFEQLLSSTKQPIPSSTQRLFNIAHSLRGIEFLYWAIGIFLVMFFIHIFFRSTYGRWLKERLLLRIPIINQLVINSILVNFLRALALLVQGGVHLVNALSIASKTVDNQFIAKYIEKIIFNVVSGHTFSDSIGCAPKWLFSDDLIALITVGQESSRLGIMINRAADIHYEKLIKAVTFFSVIFQPILIIILGLLITLLMVIIYIPIFSLSDMISF